MKKQPVYSYKPSKEGYTPENKSPKEGIEKEYFEKGRFSKKLSEERREELKKGKNIKQFVGKYLDAYVNNYYSIN